MIKQFNIPSPILSRFDTIFLFRDTRDEDKDFKISMSMKKRKSKIIKTEFDTQFLKKFFYYTQLRKEPVMTEEFMILSSKIYSKMRSMLHGEKNLNSRVSEAIDRMCIASAKIRASEVIEEKDLERVINILSESYFALPKYKDIKARLGDFI
jgi:DNA replication licensing factor MCM5